MENLDTISNTALCGHLQAFKYLFNTSNKVHQKESLGNENYYLAHNAAATGNLNLLKWTFKNTKYTVTDQDPEGLTVLHVACLTSNLNIVEWVIKYTHLSPVTRTEEGATVLHFSCWSGNFEITKLLIETEPRLINMRMLNGATAAMFATQGGYIDIMEFLLNEGANFGLPTKTGVSCLHMAAQQGHLDAVKWLVENTGLRLNGKDDNGITPIHYAAVHNHHVIVSWLLEKEVRLLKERFIVGCQNSISVNESEPIEDLLNSQSSLSIKKICDFSSLESVQEKLTLILSQYNQNSLNKKMESESNGLVQCSIPISVLLLLQSALVDLRSQYQKILRQSYMSMKVSEHNQISEETQTVELDERPGKYITSPGHKEIPRPSISHQRNDCTPDNLITPPPPPPVGPPQLVPSLSDSPKITTSNDLLKNKTNKKYINHRRGSSSDDIKISLIQELKKINTLRSKNNQSINYQEDTESCASNTDSSSLNDSNSLSAKIKTRNYITDSAPNLTLIFNSNGSGNSNSMIPKWKTDLVAKHISNKRKDEENLKQLNEIPAWKRQLIENKGISPNKSRKHSGSSNISTVETDELSSPRISKVTQLVSQWQNNAT